MAIAITRALASDPLIIVADEPTDNLNSRTAEATFNLSQSFVKITKIIVMMTHGRDLVQRVSRAIVNADASQRQNQSSLKLDNACSSCIDCSQDWREPEMDNCTDRMNDVDP